MGKVKIKEVFEKDPSGKILEPILVKFQHAEGNSASASLDLNRVFASAVFQSNPDASAPRDFSHLNRSGYEAKLLESKMKKDGPAKKRQLIALESDSMTYLGTNNTEETMKTYVAFKTGKKMKVYEVTPITVAPFINGHSHVKEEERDTRIQKNRDERKAAQIDLTKSFGSKKKRLMLEKKEKNQIEVSDMNESMSKASQQIKALEEEPQIKDESILTLIPPCNRDARDVLSVYNLDDLLTPDDMDMMDELAEQFLNLSAEEIAEWREAKKYSDYFFEMFDRLSKRKTDPKSIRNAKLVIYTELLIRILKLRHDQIRKKVPDIPDVFPSWLRDKALDAFTTINAKGIRNRPEASKDKTSCYVMVLVLLANDFVFDVHLMSTSLNIHIKKLLTLAKAVGITTTLNSTTKQYRGILKLPLPKPIERRGRRQALR